MSKPVQRPSNNINEILSNAAHDVEEYVNELKSIPDDFAHEHLENLKKSIDQAEDALLKYEFKKEHLQIDYDSTYMKFDSAITFLNSKKKSIEKKSKSNGKSQSLNDELAVALAALNHLVSLLRNIQEEMPKGVSITDESYKRGKKVEKVTGDKFEERR